MNKNNDILDFLKQYDGPPLTLMEVCGTHTSSIFKSGIRSMLSEKIKLVSGPGCPVCVTSKAYIDKLCELSKEENTVVCAFGDMFKVMGNSGCLNDAKASGGKVLMVYSPFDCLQKAADNPTVTYIFAAVGFETTAPLYALMIKNALRDNIKNIKLLTAIKTMPPAIEFVCNKNFKIDGFICPGHVCAVIGSSPFIPFAEQSRLPFVVAGFTPEQILGAIYLLVKKHESGAVYNIYTDVVKENGNPLAKASIQEYFEAGDATWRGLGVIKSSGLYIKPEYAEFDSGSFGLDDSLADKSACRCAEVLTGVINPSQCGLFGKVCTPSDPYGACMVSSEGACGIWYNENSGIRGAAQK